MEQVGYYVTEKGDAYINAVQTNPEYHTDCGDAGATRQAALANGMEQFLLSAGTASNCCTAGDMITGLAFSCYPGNLITYMSPTSINALRGFDRYMDIALEKGLLARGICTEHYQSARDYIALRRGVRHGYWSSEDFDALVKSFYYQPIPYALRSRP